jgi:hypothetical protein
VSAVKSETQPCRCGRCGIFGYGNPLIWFCEQHRPRQWSADARRDGSTRHLIFDPPDRRQAVEEDQRAAEGENQMDVTAYLGSQLIRPDDVRDGPRQERIASVNPAGKFDRLQLDFESGAQFSLNITNARVLAKAYGSESDAWLGHVIELSFGIYVFNGEEKETVVVKPISSANGGNPKPPPRDTINDEIPFD